jgi:ribosome maturation factor RimP
MELLKQIEAYAREKVDGSEFFVVEVVQEKSGRMIRVLLDGDTGISISKCGEVSRHISARIDEEIPDETGAFTVEVSSPGADRPLKMERQYHKHLGRDLSFRDESGTTHEGTLKSIENGVIVLEETFKEKGKKKQVIENTYAIDKIIDPKVVVSFKKIKRDE